MFNIIRYILYESLGTHSALKPGVRGAVSRAYVVLAVASPCNCGTFCERDHMRNSKYVSALTLLMLIAVGCGSASSSNLSGEGDGAGSGGSGDVALSTIADLPLTTAPVVASSQANLAKTVAKDATTGQVLAELSNDTFGAESSDAMCHMSQMLKSQLMAAGHADLIACYIQNGLSELTYDGVAQKFILSDEEGGGEHGPQGDMEFVIEVSAERGENGNIADYTLKTCEGGVQNEYINYDFDGESLNIVAKHVWSEGEDSSASEISVTGTLNEDGDFTSKTITSRIDDEWSSGNGNRSVTVVQTADAATLSAYDVNENDGNNFTVRVYGEMELLGSDDIGTIAVGDGGAVAHVVGGEGDDVFEDNIREAWDGDTTETVEFDDSAYSDLGSEDIPALGAEVAVEFTGDEVIRSCDSSGATEQAIDMEALDAACGHLMIDMNYEWIQCGGGDEGGPEGDEGGA